MKTPLLIALVALTASASAQPIDAARLDDVFGVEPQIEVNLRGSLIRLAAEAARRDEPEAALMLDGLRAVTVRVYPAPADRRAFAVERFGEIGRGFEADGWYTLVRVRSVEGSDNDDGDVWVYVRDDGDAFDGMAVLAIDPDEETAAFVLIDGTIDPTQVADLSRRFARVDLGDDEDDDE